MKTYVATSGAIFGLITLAHLARIAAEGSRVAGDPWFVLLTIATAGLSVWALQVFRGLKHP